MPRSSMSLRLPLESFYKGQISIGEYKQIKTISVFSNRYRFENTDRLKISSLYQAGHLMNKNN